MKHDYYGVPLFLMKDYLLRLGAGEAGENHFVGAGWSARLSKAPWKEIGSLRIGGTSAEFSGDGDALESLFERLHLLTMRGGG